MSEYPQSEVFDNRAPEPRPSGIPTCTAALRCTSCMEMILATWRDGENMAPSVRPVFDNYRALHKGHAGYQEAVPEFGPLPEELAPAIGTTRVDRVGLTEEAEAERVISARPPEAAPKREEPFVYISPDFPPIGAYYR